MGCAPTAQRMSQIPSNNVHQSSKSTKSTLKNSESILSPQKINFSKDDYGTKDNKLRFYSPRCVKQSQQQDIRFSPLKTRNNPLGQQNTHKKDKNILELKQQTNTKPLDLISHLSLNSQINSKQQQNGIKAKVKRYPVTQKKSPLKKYMIEQETTKKKTVISSPRHKKQTKSNKKMQTQQQNKKRFNEILQAQLNNMNSEKFQRVDIQKMHF